MKQSKAWMLVLVLVLVLFVGAWQHEERELVLDGLRAGGRCVVAALDGGVPQDVWRVTP